MATLAEAGLSSNLGLSDQPVYDADRLAATLHYNLSDPYSLRDRQGSAFNLPIGFELGQTEEGMVSLGTPIGSTGTFKQPYSMALNPVFSRPYAKFDHNYRASDVVVLDDEESATFTHRAQLNPIVERCRDWADRAPTYLFLGQGAIKGFVVSSLELLDVKNKKPMPVVEDDFRLAGDDFLASRFIQLAEISDTDVHDHIPPNHVDRALQELVFTTFVNHFAFLKSAEDIDRGSGAWHVGAGRFARGYGVDADEIADAALMLSDAIYDAIQTRRAPYERQRSDVVIALQPEAARKIAEYLIAG